MKHKCTDGLLFCDTHPRTHIIRSNSGRWQVWSPKAPCLADRIKVFDRWDHAIGFATARAYEEAGADE